MITQVNGMDLCFTFTNLAVGNTLCVGRMLKSCLGEIGIKIKLALLAKINVCVSVSLVWG